VGKLGRPHPVRRGRRRTARQSVLGGIESLGARHACDGVLVVANVLVWISFLVFNPQRPESEFAEITARRAGQGSQDGLDIIDDAPIIVAGRWSGTFGAVNAADYALHLSAGPAVTFAEWIVVPPLSIGSDATKGESYVIAGVAFVLSTSFWTAFGGSISALRRAYLRRRSG
jgi:hypothetical protein